MNQLKSLLLTLALALFLTPAADAATFVIKRIRFQGLSHIDQQTVRTYLPVRAGKTFDTANAGKVVKALYKTGFFEHVTVSQQGNTLIIKVKERAAIGSLAFSGYDALKEEEVRQVLSDEGILEGYIFNPGKLARAKAKLRLKYQAKGYYDVQFNVTETKLPRHRVGLFIDIDEGDVAKIKEIVFKGNKAFSSSTLRKQLFIRTSSLLTWLNSRDHFSEQALDASLQKLSGFYFDRGYLKFHVKRTQVDISDDKEKVRVVISIHEGQQYTISGFKLSGKFPIKKERLAEMITVQPGDVFSRAKMRDIVADMSEALGEEGYAFPEINPQPKFNNKKHTVFVNFRVKPGEVIYVRQINFGGNVRTASYVLRRAMRQEEGAVLSLTKVRESRRQLRMLPYLKNIRFKSTPVDKKDDQVDLLFDIDEAPPASASVGIGYGTDGAVVNANLKHGNFLGTGRTVGLSFNHSKWGDTYSFDYYNPYFTTTGIGHGYSVYYSKLTPNKLNGANYTADRIAASTNFNIPVGERLSYQASAGYSRFEITSVKQLTTGIPVAQVFVNRYGKVQQHVNLTTGVVYNSHDRAMLPTKGVLQQLSIKFALPVANNSVGYYKANYHADWYQPLGHDFIFTTQANFGYGDGFRSGDTLPFYDGYYAGGLAAGGRVRGYQTNSLGSKDVNGDPFGGNILVSGTVGLIVPTPLGHSDSFRTQLFVDMGNVYYNGPARFGGTGEGPIRFSGGIEFDWRSPLGPLSFSLAKPLNKHRNDETEFFQFTIGTSI